MGRARIEMVGLKYGRLTVVGRGLNYSNGRSHQAQWICECECGNTTRPIIGADLRRGHIRSCGCLRDEKIARVNRRHGQTVGRKRSPEFNTWLSMKRRCSADGPPKLREHYFDRGIRVCDRWLNGENGKSGVECFVEDVGLRPSSEHSIDRINNDGHYEPGNCKWATDVEQANNKRTSVFVTLNGQRMTVAEALRATGEKVSFFCAYSRIRKGWDAETALTKPARIWPSQARKAS